MKQEITIYSSKRDARRERKTCRTCGFTEITGSGGEEREWFVMRPMHWWQLKRPLWLCMPCALAKFETLCLAFGDKPVVREFEDALRAKLGDKVKWPVHAWNWVEGDVKK